MRLSRSLALLSCAATLAIAAAGCHDAPDEPGIGPPAALIVTGGGGVIGVGDTVPLNARVVDAGGSIVQGSTVAWRSLDTAIVHVDAGGRILGWEAGTTAIVASTGTLADTVRFTVEIVPRSISMTVTPFTGRDTTFVGNSVTVRATVHDGRGRALTGAPITYSVADTMMALPPTVPPRSGSATSEVLAAGPITFIAQSGAVRGETIVRASLYPSFVQGLALSQIGMGEGYACGLDAGGRAVCWGHSAAGGLGRTVSSNAPPAPVDGGRAFTTLRVGSDGSCGITAGKRLWCWGASAIPYGTAAPTAILDGVDVAEVSIDAFAERTSCALTTAGETWCWSSQSALARVSSPVAFTRLAHAGSTICGLTATGRAWCKGFVFGDAFVEATGAYPPLVSIGISGSTPCGLTSDGRAFCWGSGSQGQRGDGSAGSTWATSPQPVQTTERFSALAPGMSHVCGLTTTGTMLCWGVNPSLLAGHVVVRRSPFAASPEHFLSLVGGTRASCGVLADGSLRCLGAPPTLTQN